MSATSKRRQERRAKTPWLKYKSVFLILLSFATALWAQGQTAKSYESAAFWPGLLGFAVAVLLFLVATREENPDTAPALALSPRVESLGAGLVFLVAIFMRFWKLGEVPPGVFMDQGYQGYAALRILHEGQRPFFDHAVLQEPAVFLYELAGWFWLFGADALSSRAFYATVSLLALPFLYWSLRELAGPRTALLSLFIFSVMRWPAGLSRWHIGVHTFLFMFSSLALFQYGRRTGKAWPFWSAGALLGAGMYYYLSYYAFPFLLLVYLGYEFAADRPGVLRQKRPLRGMLALFLALFAPLGIYLLTQGGIGKRLGQVNVFTQIHDHHGLRPLWDNLMALLLMFHRKGDYNGRHNPPYLPMLDAITGVLFLLGFFYALRRWKKRESFYALAALGLLSLPGVLSGDMPHATRLMGLTPFVALVAAFPIMVFSEKLRLAFGHKSRVLTALAVISLLGTMAWKNFNEYFTPQMKSQWVWYWWDPIQTSIGQQMAKEGGKADFFVTNRCYQNDTIRFLGYSHRKSYNYFSLPDLLPLFPEDPSHSAVYALETQRIGMRTLIKALFPGAREESMEDPTGEKVFYFYSVSRESLEKARGLQGKLSTSPASRKFGRFPADLPPGPFQGDLEGCVLMPQSGTYKLEVLGNVKVALKVGGKTLRNAEPFYAPCGYYGMQVSLRAPSGNPSLQMILHLPDGNPWELNWTNLTPLPLNHGLLVTNEFSSPGHPYPKTYMWAQMVDFDLQCDYPFLSQGERDVIQPVEWRGELEVRKSGLYEFLPWSTQAVNLTVGGRKYKCGGRSSTGKIYLGKGPHTFFLEAPNPLNNLTLAWKRPGSDHFSPVPMEAFGITKLF